MTDHAATLLDAGELDLLRTEIDLAVDLDTLERCRIKALGKKGLVSLALKGLGSLPADRRKDVGATINLTRDELTTAIENRRGQLEVVARAAAMASEALDVSLPPLMNPPGRLHPITQVIDEASAIFAAMGFRLAEGPDIESDALNFTALNFPPDHPAREMHDTFYIADPPEDGPMVLRTHTSPVQIRAMMADGAPIRVIAPGRTYRSDHDMTHSPMFHQIEGMVIDEQTNFTHLKGCLYDFCRAFFELDDVPLRFRPSFFPFTEPSAEVDIACTFENGRLEIGAGGQWMEILGCGMTHPNVIRNGGLDPTRYQGFAFGLGVERLAMLKYGMPDLRPFFYGDGEWTRHYGAQALEFPTLSRGLRV